MNYEENRLNSFRCWPTAAEVGPIGPIRIAKGGFFYTGHGLEVQCFSCNGKISNWCYGDSVMERHRSLNPECPFVVDANASGNIPMILEQHCPNISNGNRPSSMREAMEIDLERNHGANEEDGLYKNDALRLLSFVNWPVSAISRESLVSAGFYHAGDLRVRCAWCGGEIPNQWRAGDSPLDEHCRRFPQCQHAIQLQEARRNEAAQSSQYSLPVVVPEATISPTNQPLPTINHPISEGASNSLSLTWRALGVVGGADGARHPSRASLSARLSTFQRWPPDRAQTPHALATAGFYYEGSDDQVRCFYCDGGLAKWEPGDSPWKEHARCFPQCGYVRLVKGADFVNKCQEANATPTEDVQINIGNTANQVARRRSERSNGNHPVTESQVEEQMLSLAAIAALGAGLDVARVKRAIRQRLRTVGSPFNCAEALIDAVLDGQLNEEPWSADPAEVTTRRYARDILADTFADLAAHTGLLQTWSEQSDVSESDSSATSPTPITRSPPDISRAKSPNLNVDKPKTLQIQDNCDSAPVRNISLEEENRQLREARLCKVCMDSEVSVVFLPCGHLVSCTSCGASLTACPLCRAAVRALVRAYLA